MFKLLDVEHISIKGHFWKYSIYEIIFKILISSGLDVPTFE